MNDAERSAPVVGILLATYNGAPHLGAQLDSIAAQDRAAWHIRCGDDGSQYASQEILDRPPSWGDRRPKVTP